MGGRFSCIRKKKRKITADCYRKLEEAPPSPDAESEEIRSLFNSDEVMNSPIHDLVRLGADINALDQEGLTPLHVAVMHNNRTAIAALVKAGADVGAFHRYQTVLHFAVQTAREDTVRLLVELSGDVMVRDSDGQTLLHMAAAHGQLSLLQYFVKKGGNLRCTDINGQTPLHKATVKKKLEVVLWILEQGEDVDTPDWRGWNPLQQAAWWGHTRLAEVFLERKADVNWRTKEGKTSLHLAAYQGYDEVIELLLRSNAAVNPRDNYGRTPLYYANRRSRRFAYRRSRKFKPSNHSVALLRERGGIL